MTFNFSIPISFLFISSQGVEGGEIGGRGEGFGNWRRRNWGLGKGKGAGGGKIGSWMPCQY